MLSVLYVKCTLCSTSWPSAIMLCLSLKELCEAGSAETEGEKCFHLRLVPLVACCVSEP